MLLKSWTRYLTAMALLCGFVLLVAAIARAHAQDVQCEPGTTSQRILYSA
jgi:hypothetical protein